MPTHGGRRAGRRVHSRVRRVSGLMRRYGEMSTEE